MKEFHFNAHALQKCMSAKDTHNADFLLMLQDISQRKANTARFGNRKDTLLSYFHYLLGETLKDTPSLDQTSLKENDLSHRYLLRSQRNGRAAAVLKLRRKGLSSIEVAANLGISQMEVMQAEKRLLSLYGRACRRIGEQRPRSEMKNLYRLIRKDTTGAMDFRFFNDNRLIGSAHSLLIHGYPMVLQCGTLILNTNFSLEQTTVPGVSRVVFDADNSVQFARLTYTGANTHVLHLNWDTGKRTFHIKTCGEMHRIYLHGELYADIFPSEKFPYPSDWDVRYFMQVYHPVSDNLAFMFLTFPLLRLA